MSTVSDAVQRTLREELEPTIKDVLWNLDPVYPMVKSSSKRVVNKGIGRGHKVIKTYVVGVAGGAKFGSVSGGNVVSGPDNFNVWDTPPTFQGIDETTNRAFFHCEQDLIEQRGNFFLPHQIMRMDKYNSSIGSVVAQNLKGVATLVAQQEAALFYAVNSTYELGDVGDASANVADVSGDTSAITVDLSGTSAGGRIHRMLQGMLVDLYDSTGATHRNPDFLIAIDDVDPINQTVTLRRLDGGELQDSTTLNGGITYDGAGGDNDIIVIKDSVSTGPLNLNSWIKNSGTLFGVPAGTNGIDLSIHSMFKSLIKSETTALTESILNKRYYEFNEAYPGKRLPHAITTMGVLMGLMDNLQTGVLGGYADSGSGDNPGVARFDRNGQALDLNLGFDGFRYRFAGRPVMIHTSTYCEKGYWYGLNLSQGNLVRYVPPSLPGARGDSRIGQELEFIAPIGGSNSIFMHATSGGRATDYVQAPFVRQWQIMPEDPVSLKMSGITEISTS